MFTLLKRLTKLAFLGILIALLTFWGVRAYSAWKAAPLQLWHTFIPKELTIAEMSIATWEQYLQREEQLFADVRAQVTEKLPPETRTQSNRFYSGARIYSPNFTQNWNRSYVIEPTNGNVRGAVVFLHGLTDAPFSMRHLAREYAKNGFVAIGLRIPAHGTVPAALTDVTWEDWSAATRLAMREATRRIDHATMPLHIVGFSNGGALAMKYTLDALEDRTLARPDRVVLISPMIGITRFARFAGLAGVPAMFPAFAHSAWLGIVPEFNPFKYNSFPVNGARQSHRLTIALQDQISRMSRQEVFNDLPPILTFQSVMDYTVHTSAILYSLYAYLPENGSELVLFDVNRATVFGPLMRSAAEIALTLLLPPLPQRYRITVVTNISPSDLYTEARTTEAGSTKETSQPLNIIYPPHIFSLSHVAIPFPMDDELYGMTPLPGSDAKFGVNLGTMAARGERGALIVNLDSLFRTTSNPFFPFLMERVVAGIKDPLPEHPARRPLPDLPVPPPAYAQDVEKFLHEAEENTLAP